MSKFYELFFELPYLITQLGIIEVKCLILRSNNGILRLKRRILVIRQRNSLTKYRSRAMLVNELFETVKQSHVIAPQR